MKRRKVTAAAVTHLPDDIIFEILIRVSFATSLWEFRCVCKSWCSMISSPKFIQSHLKNSLLTSNFALFSNTFHKPTTKIIPSRTLLALDGSSDYYSAGDSSSDDESHHLPIPKKYAIKVDCPVFMKDYNGDPPSVSTCNGLCLISVNERDFYLWNPFIKQIRKLPDFLDHTELVEYSDDDPIIIRCGAFGFDDRSHDYNIVAFIESYPNKNPTKFYSFKTDSWTRLENFECTGWHGTGQFLNGEFHWVLLADFTTLILRFMLVSLSLSTQVQRAVDLQNNLNISLSCRLRDQDGGRPEISVHGGCLYLLSRYKSTFDIWVLQDNGVPDSSWVMVATIPFDDFNNWYGCPKSKILYMTEEGSFLFSRELRDIVVYESKSGSCIYPSFRSSFPHADVCIQSLVSPFPDGMVKKKTQTGYNESPNRSCNRTKSQMARATRRSPPPSLSHSTVYTPPLSLSSLRRSRRLLRLPPSQSMAASESLTRMKGGGQDTQIQAGSSTIESQNRSSKRTKSQMALPTRRSPRLSSSPSTVYLPESSGSSLRRSPRLQHSAPPPSSSSSPRRSTRFHHLTPSPSTAEQDSPGSRF